MSCSPTRSPHAGWRTSCPTSRSRTRSPRTPAGPSSGRPAASLLSRAVDDRAVRADITVDDLLTLIVGIALATENYTDPKAQAERAFRIAVVGLDATGA